MVLYFLITCFSFILFIKSLPLKPLPPWTNEMRLLSFWFWKDLPSSFPISQLINNSLLSFYLSLIPPYKMSLIKKSLSSKVENVEEETAEMSVLDLPELALERILEMLPPASLSTMAGVCTSLRERCKSDHLWEKHMKQKWGRVVGAAAYRDWQCHISSKTDSNNLKQGKQKGLIRLLSLSWPVSWFRSKVDDCSKQRSSLPVDSIMSWYLALETGKFWFPAQVYNREVLTVVICIQLCIKLYSVSILYFGCSLLN